MSDEPSRPGQGMPFHDASDRDADRQRIAARRDAVVRAWERTHASLTDLLAERDEVERALAEGRAERELGVPCLTFSPLRARLDACQKRIGVLEGDMRLLDAQYDALSAQMGALDLAGH